MRQLEERVLGDVAAIYALRLLFPNLWEEALRLRPQMTLNYDF